MKADWLIENVHLATMQADDIPYGAQPDGLVAVKEGLIAWVGPRRSAPDFKAADRYDGEGGWLTPGLIDCHTHIVYGGNRAKEFEARLQGQSYEQIAANGGGILSTVEATRATDEDTLFESALARLDKLMLEGVTTIEIKSGYGLDKKTELRMLKVARSLAEHAPVTVHTSYLGAHALPPEYKDDADGYIDFICNTVLPKVAKKDLADAVDLFCDKIGFSLQQCRRVFECAQALGLPVKGHVEQLSLQGGAELVAAFDGLSADHIEYIDERGIRALAEHQTTAVLLPAAFYFLNETQKPPVQALREAGIPMAVASDCNPGSAPQASLLLAMNQACVLFGLTPEEALTGATRNAARALGLDGVKGEIKETLDADLLLWQIDHPAELSYAVNMHHPTCIWKGGKRV